MTYAQILSQRPFNLTDGDRFLIVTNLKEGNQVFTRSYKNKPIFTKNFKEAKTFKERKTLDACIKNIFTPNNYSYKVFQVKDLFEPRYYVKYHEKRILQEPTVKCYPDWFIQGENQVNTYIDYNEALTALAKGKCELLEYYYQHILKIRTITLPDFNK